MIYFRVLYACIDGYLQYLHCFKGYGTSPMFHNLHGDCDQSDSNSH